MSTEAATHTPLPPSTHQVSSYEHTSQRWSHQAPSRGAKERPIHEASSEHVSLSECSPVCSQAAQCITKGAAQTPSKQVSSPWLSECEQRLEHQRTCGRAASTRTSTIPLVTLTPAHAQHYTTLCTIQDTTTHLDTPQQGAASCPKRHTQWPTLHSHQQVHSHTAAELLTPLTLASTQSVLPLPHHAQKHTTATRTLSSYDQVSTHTGDAHTHHLRPPPTPATQPHHVTQAMLRTDTTTPTPRLSAPHATFATLTTLLGYSAALFPQVLSLWQKQSTFGHQVALPAPSTPQVTLHTQRSQRSPRDSPPRSGESSSHSHHTLRSLRSLRSHLHHHHSQQHKARALHSASPKQRPT